jgi:hypothetical protein
MAEDSTLKTFSYAQNLEDVQSHRVFAGRRDSFYVDVGAGDPILHSATKPLAQRGWHGINIEPIPTAFEFPSSDRELEQRIGGVPAIHRGDPLPPGPLALCDRRVAEGSVIAPQPQ